MDKPETQSEALAEDSTTARAFMLFIGLIGFAGLVVQCFITVRVCLAKGMSVAGAMSKFLSYFTVLTNLMVVVVCLAAVLVLPQSRVGRFFTRHSVRTGTMMYIAFICGGYALLLQHLWQPEGLQWMADMILHYFVPVSFVIWWIFLVPKTRLNWSLAVQWLTYPALYFACTLVRGEFTGDYPYPFLDVSNLGYTTTFGHALVLMLTLVVVGLALIFVSRKSGPARPPEGLGIIRK